MPRHVKFKIVTLLFTVTLLWNSKLCLCQCQNKIRALTLTVSPSQASVTSQSASLCSRLASTSVRLLGWLFQRKQNCWSIVGASVSDRAANNTIPLGTDSNQQHSVRKHHQHMRTIYFLNCKLCNNLGLTVMYA